jgi:hypothetical protein
MLFPPGRTQRERFLSAQQSNHNEQIFESPLRIAGINVASSDTAKSFCNNISPSAVNSKPG